MSLYLIVIVQLKVPHWTRQLWIWLAWKVWAETATSIARCNGNQMWCHGRWVWVLELRAARMLSVFFDLEKSSLKTPQETLSQSISLIWFQYSCYILLHQIRDMFSAVSVSHNEVPRWGLRIWGPCLCNYVAFLMRNSTHRNVEQEELLNVDVGRWRAFFDDFGFRCVLGCCRCRARAHGKLLSCANPDGQNRFIFRKVVSGSFLLIMCKMHRIFTLFSLVFRDLSKMHLAGLEVTSPFVSLRQLSAAAWFKLGGPMRYHEANKPCTVHEVIFIPSSYVCINMP